MLTTLHSAFGLCAFLLVAWGLSENRRAPWLSVAATGAAIQLAIGFVLLQVSPVREAFHAVNFLVLAMQQATEAGTSFVFGYLGGGPLPFEQSRPGAAFILAFRALPLIIVVSALTAVLTYWRILPLVVRGFSVVLERTMGVSGAVGVAAAANIFVGMVEAPLFVRLYLSRMTRSELFVLMTTGMATVAGTMLVLYASVLGATVPDAAGHLLIASVISAPAAITIARLMVPPDQGPDRSAGVSADETTRAPVQIVSESNGTMDAITHGTRSGLELFLNVVAMLLVLVALVYLVNAGLSLLPSIGGAPITLERVLGVAMSPVVWLMGIPWAETSVAGALMGTKTILNEFLAYLALGDLPEAALSARSRLIMTYALCGFANLGSLGILIGGLSTMVPERRDEIVSLGLKSLVAGTLATCCTGAVVGVII